jgi:hypothetical protein
MAKKRNQGREPKRSGLERVLLLFFSFVFLVAPAPAPGNVGTIEALELSFALETKLFESAFQRYVTARDEEKKALSVLVDLAEKTDLAIVAQNLDDQGSWAVEEKLVSARSEFLSASIRAADHRRTIYRHVERLTELGMVIGQHRDRSLVKTEQLDGRWRIDLTPSNEFGLMDLHLDGTMVTGTFRLSSGAQGSIRGTYVNHRLRLERVDTQMGYDMTLTGVHDLETGEIGGIWNATGPTNVGGSAGGESTLLNEIRDKSNPLDGSGPRDLQGEWTARKISPAEEQEILPE